MPDVLLKRWNDWSAGIGHPLDDGRTPGMQYAAGLLGMRNGLKVAPFFNVVVPEMTMSENLDNAVVYAHVAVMLKPADTGTPIAYAASGSAQNDGASLTFAFDPDLTANGYLIVCVSAAGNADPTGVTFNAVAMAKLVSVSNGANVTSSIWGLANPTDASQNVVVTHAAGHKVVAGAISFDNVHQTTSTGDTATDADTVGANPAYVKLNITPGTGDMGVDCITGLSAFAHAAGIRQTERWDLNEGTIRGSGSTQPANTAFQPQFFYEEPESSDADSQHLYYEQDDDGVTGSVLHKVSLKNADFGTSEGEHAMLVSGTNRAGQAARYQGSWWFPGGNNQAPLELSTVGSGAVSGDTLDLPSTMAAGSDHLANLNSQIVGVVADGTNAGGVRILKLDGTPDTNGDWGSVFQVGDKNERVAGLRGLEGMVFVSTREGLFSFNSKGRSRMVFEDFRSWPNTFANIPISALKGGLLLTHPSGLQWYKPGELPIGVGVGSTLESTDVPLPGVSELKGGRYHSTAVAGDYAYAIYQPDPSSTTALVKCGYTPSGDPKDLVWQGLGTITLLNADHMMAIGVAVGGKPLSSSYVTPTAWFGDTAGLKYIVLNSRAGPFRIRADTHKVGTTGTAYMSELVLSEPFDLTRLVVTTDDMASGDEWQVSLIAEDGRESNLGPSIKSDGRKPLKIDRHSVQRLVVRVTFTGTSTAARVPPSIKMMELYGNPEVGVASAG